METESQNKSERKWYTSDDVTSAKQKLGDLPDLRTQRLKSADVLKELVPEIQALAQTKGYSAEDIRLALEQIGISVAAKGIREIIAQGKKQGKRTTRRAKTEPTEASSAASQPPATDTTRSI